MWLQCGRWIASVDAGRILFPLAAAVTKSSNHYALGGIEGRKVNGGEVGWHWSEPLWVSGEWLRGRVSNEPLAPNAVIIAQGTEEQAPEALKH